jgi:hypothetical protein
MMKANGRESSDKKAQLPLLTYVLHAQNKKVLSDLASLRETGGITFQNTAPRHETPLPSVANKPMSPHAYPVCEVLFQKWRWLD